jgi:hypothetical protein
MSKFTQSIARESASILVGGLDAGGAAITLREAIMAKYAKAGVAKGKPLPVEFVKMIEDEASILIEASKTIGEGSRKVVKANVKKLATYAPVISALTGEVRESVGKSIANMLKFGTCMNRAEGKLSEAVALYAKGKEKNNAKSAAMHIKSILSMKGRERFLTGPAKATLVAFCLTTGIALGDYASEYGDPTLAAKFGK